MAPAKTMVVDCPSKQPLPLHLDRFPNATVVKGIPTAEQFRRFLDGLDVVYTAETPYNYDLFDIAERMGVRSVLHYNYEFLDYLQRPNLPQPTVFAAPSLWHYNDVPYSNKVHLPVPTATERFPRIERDRATRILHIVGRPAIHDRNGTADLVTALQYVQSEITVTIRCQDPRYVPRLLTGARFPKNIDLRIQSGDSGNYWDNYDADVLVMPRRFGGLCLPVNEALAAGMPVVMPDISPNSWLPAEWLAPASFEGRFMAKTMIDLHTINHISLAARIDQFAGDPEFYRKAVEQALDIAGRYSWGALKPEYDRILKG